MDVRREPLTLASGPYRLPGELWRPPDRAVEKARLALVLCHGSTQKGMRHELIRHLASELARKWPVLTFDLPGFGRAPMLVIRGPGDYLYHEHLLAAARKARELTGLPVVLIGHSMGGRVSLQAAIRGQEEGLVIGVVTLAGLYDLPSDPEAMEALVADFASYVRVRFEVPMEEVARAIAESRPTLRAVEALKVPLLAVEAGREVYGFIRETRYELFRKARCPKTLVLLGRADHKFKDHHDKLVEIISGWLEHRTGVPS